MKERNKDVAELIERTRGYGANGSAALKAQPKENPQYVRKTHKNVRSGEVVKHETRNVLQKLPTAVKAEMLITVIIVAAVMIALMAVQVAVGIVTADNNAMLRDIEALENESHRLTEQIDNNVDMDSVFAVIESEGLVMPNSLTDMP